MWCPWWMVSLTWSREWGPKKEENLHTTRKATLKVVLEHCFGLSQKGWAPHIGSTMRPTLCVNFSLAQMGPRRITSTKNIISKRLKFPIPYYNHFANFHFKRQYFIWNLKSCRGWIWITYAKFVCHIHSRFYLGTVYLAFC